MRPHWPGAMLLLLLICGSVPVMGAAPKTAPDPWATVRRYAALPESDQRAQPVQAEFQRWYLARVQSYAQCLDDTALGRAKKIDLGDFSARARQILCAPYGTGEYRIVFNGCTTPGVPVWGSRVIQFPQAEPDKSIYPSVDRFNTCWHEIQHAMTMLREASGRPPIVVYNQWSMYAKPPKDDVREHLYIESLAEYTVEWLDTLLHEKTALSLGTVAGKSFEKRVLEAYEQQKAHEKAGTCITYALEHGIWAKAHDAWASAWPSAQKIAPMTDDLRNDYRDLTGVQIPYIEDVIKFYHGGGLKSPDGKGIHVPRWVMEGPPMKSPVIIGHLSPTERIDKDTLRYSFDVRILEGYRFRDRTQSINVGKAVITMSGGAAPYLEITAAGRPKVTGGASKPVTIPLTGFARDGSIALTFVHPGLSKVSGTARYPIRVTFTEDPVTANGKTKFSFYYKSEAVYYIEVKGSAKPAAAASGRISSGGKTSASSSPVSSAGSTGAAPGKPKSGRWKLTRAWTEQNPTIGNAAIATTWDLTQTGVSFAASQNGSYSRFSNDIAASWTAPPDTIEPGVAVELSQSIDTVKCSDAAVATFRSAWNAKYPRLPAAYELSTSANPRVSAHPKTSVGPDGERYEVRRTQTCHLEAPDGAPSEKFLLSVVADGHCGSNRLTGAAYWEYTWEAGASEPETGTARVTMTAEEPPKPERDPVMDDEAPEPGDVVKLGPPEKDPPRKGDDGKTKPVKDPAQTAPVVRWYTHPSGDYRMQLPDGWSVSAKHLLDDADSGYDTLWAKDQEMAVVVSRSANDTGSTSADAILRGFAEARGKASPGARSLRMLFGSAQGMLVSEYESSDKVMSWHAAFCMEGKSYSASIVMPAEKEPSALLAAVRGMLGTIGFVH